MLLMDCRRHARIFIDRFDAAMLHADAAYCYYLQRFYMLLLILCFTTRLLTIRYAARMPTTRAAARCVCAMRCFSRVAATPLLMLDVTLPPVVYFILRYFSSAAMRRLFAFSPLPLRHFFLPPLA